MVTTIVLAAVIQATAAAGFWTNLQALCGKAYQGRVLEAPPGDKTFAGQRLMMHVRECSADTIRVPFHVGDDRSRTWVFTRVGDRVRLKHDHRHADGSEDKVTQYGGDSRDGGSATVMEFPADAQTTTLLPEAKTNVWTVEVDPAKGRFVYALRREGTDRRFRIEFDTTKPVAAPPPPWGPPSPGFGGARSR